MKVSFQLPMRRLEKFEDGPEQGRMKGDFRAWSLGGRTRESTVDDRAFLCAGPPRRAREPRRAAQEPA
jgi:hypothetical protein